MDQLASLRERGLTLVEILVVMAILAILAVGGYGLMSLIPESANATSKTVLKQAVRQLTIQALSDAGAEMTWDGKGQLDIRSLGPNPVIKSYPLSRQVTISLNGQPFQCLVLSPQGFPDNRAVANCNSGNNPTIPLTWSVSDGSNTITFQ